MNRTCLNNNIINIQCIHSTLGVTLSDHLSAGTRKVVCLDRYNIATGYVLDILRGYKPFESDVTYAYKFTFTRPVGDTASTTVSMQLKDNTLTPYTGTGNGTDIAVHFETLIKAGGLTIAYQVERVGNVLYVYTYDSGAAYTDNAVTVANPVTTKVTAVSKSLENNLDELLNIWNSLTEKELCNLITFATTTAGKTAGGSSTSSGGCNC